MMYALDRASIVKAIYGGYATIPTGGNCTSYTPGYDPKLTPWPYDVAKAKQLLSDAGQTSFTIPFESKNVDSSVPNVQALCQALIGYWKEVGITCKYTALDPSTEAQLDLNRQIPGIELTGYPGTRLYSPLFFANVQLYSKATINLADDPKIDAYIAQMNATLDPAAIATVATALDDYLHDSVTTPAIIGLPSLTAVGPHVLSWNLQKGNATASPWWDLRAI